MEASLYLHIPFCEGACDYCDFYSVPAKKGDDRFDRFVDVLLDDVEKSMDEFAVDHVPSVYVGGGTPSMLGASRIARLFHGLSAILPGVSPVEVTVEANPESASEDFILACAASGVSRLSLGLQSLNMESRMAVGRLGGIEKITEVVDNVRSLFPGSLSLDIISALPRQSEQSLLSDIDFAASSGADHVSLYALTLEDGTPLAAKARADRSLLPKDDEADELWIAGRDALERLGFRQYEVSNFAKSGKECLHNRRYWRMESYIGCGPGAVGTVVDEGRASAVRLSWAPDAASWLREGGSSHEADRETINRKDLLAECVIMGFRTREGIDEALFSRRFGAPVEEFIGRTLDSWRRKNWAEGDRPALNAEGLLRLNGFLIACLDELDAKPGRVP